MRTGRARTAILAAAAAVVLALAGCARSGTGGTPDAAQYGGGHGQAAPARVEGPPEVAIAASSFQFAPAELTLTAGEPVNIVMTSTDTLHDLTIDARSFHLAAEPGQTAAGGLVIDEPGTYTAYCTVPGHRQAGMEATVIVQ
ncbi:MAG: plastocyanin/azurin family copper-binding protein [Egibacteraceae bacterium]